MSEQSQPRRSDHIVVGHFDARHEIIVYREPEVGIAWEAEAVGLGLSALGRSPNEAARTLIAAIGRRGTVGKGTLSDPSAIVGAAYPALTDEDLGTDEDAGGDPS